MNAQYQSDIRNNCGEVPSTEILCFNVANSSHKINSQNSLV